MTTQVSVRVDVPTILVPEVDDDVIAGWIEARLNNARNHFIMQMARGGGGGRVYRRGQKFHRASAPGEYPVTDGGRLANSVSIQMTDKLEGRLSSDVEYAEYLTSGTSRMAPRKMLADALQEMMERRPMFTDLARAAHWTRR